jgi:hypothetical protein
MKSYATVRRHAFGEVVARTNEDRHRVEVVPCGQYGAGVWTGHPIEFVGNPKSYRHSRIALVFRGRAPGRRIRSFFTSPSPDSAKRCSANKDSHGSGFV